MKRGISMNRPFRIFSSPSKRSEVFISAFLNELPALTAVNLLLVLTSLPVFTLLPSLCAVHAVCEKIISGEETKPFHDYFFFFFSSFKRSLVFEAAVFPFFFLSSFGIYSYIRLSSVSGYFLVGAVLCISALLFLILFFVSLPESVNKQMNVKEAFMSFVSDLSKNALKLFIGFLTIGVPVLILPYSLPVLLLISFSVCSLSSCCLCCRLT